MAENKIRFYCKALKCCFYVNMYQKDEKTGDYLLDKNGKKIPIYRKLANGETKYLNGEPLVVRKLMQFLPISFNPKIGYLCCYEIPADENGKPLEAHAEEYAAILRERGMAGNSILSEDEYKQQENPKAWAAEKALAVANKKLDDREKEIKAKEDILAQMNRQLEEAKRQIQQNRK